MKLGDYLYKQDKNIQKDNEDIQPVTPSQAIPDNLDNTPPPVQQQDTDNQIVPVTADNTKQVSPDDLRNGGYYNILKSWNEPSYDKQEASLKRQRTASIIGDIANIFARGIGLSQGARKFAPIQSATPGINQKIDYLQKLKAAQNADMANKSLQAMYNDYKNKQDEAAAAAKEQLARDEMEQKDKEFNLNLGETTRHNKVDEGYKGQEIQQGGQRIKETATHNRAMEGIGRSNAASNAASARASLENANTNRSRLGLEADKFNYSKTGAGKGMDSITLNEGGNLVPHNYSKINNDAILPLYNEMSRLANSNPKKYGTIPDIMIRVGEGGDQRAKALQVIKANIARFPELTGKAKGLLGIKNALPQNTFNKNQYKTKRPL